MNGRSVPGTSWPARRGRPARMSRGHCGSQRLYESLSTTGSASAGARAEVARRLWRRAGSGFDKQVVLGREDHVLRQRLVEPDVISKQCIQQSPPQPLMMTGMSWRCFFTKRYAIWAAWLNRTPSATFSGAAEILERFAVGRHEFSLRRILRHLPSGLPLVLFLEEPKRSRASDSSSASKQSSPPNRNRPSFPA